MKIWKMKNKGGGHMKRNICIIIIICLLAILSFSFADDVLALGENNKEQFKQTRTQIEDRMKEYRDKINEVKAMNNVIRQNNEKLVALKKEATNAQKKAKNHIQELIKDKDSITDKQFIKLKEAVVTLEDARKVLRVTIGKIGRVTTQLRTARQNKNIHLISQHGKEIIKEQNLRIKELEKLIEDLESISEI